MYGQNRFGTTRFGSISDTAGLPPIVDAGANRILHPGATSVTLTGTATDPEGQPITKVWTMESGPASVTQSSSTSLTNMVTGLIAGVYTFRLTVSDGTNEAYDETTVTVQAKKKKGVTAVTRIGKKSGTVDIVQ